MTEPNAKSEEVKTFKWTPKNAGAPEMRMRIATAAEASEVRVLSLEERPAGRGWTKIEVTVAGHPRQIRAFDHEVHDTGSSSWTNGGGDGLDDLAIGFFMDVVGEPVFNAVREKWKRRRDPPLPEEIAPGPGEARTTVNWKWERMLPDGDAIGPVRVDSYVAQQDEPTESEDWPEWVKRSEALAFAQEHGFVFVPLDLPDGE